MKISSATAAPVVESTSRTLTETAVVAASMVKRPVRRLVDRFGSCASMAFLVRFLRPATEIGRRLHCREMREMIALRLDLSCCLLACVLPDFSTSSLSSNGYDNIKILSSLFD